VTVTEQAFRLVPLLLSHAAVAVGAVVTAVAVAVAVLSAGKFVVSFQCFLYHSTSAGFQNAIAIC
jgi:hypothetical protein